ncbi:selenium-dependent molybdenum cofactor biosynthesis protein YqeB [Anaerotignum lactatifermentans]|uniref:selenium-dependent molybdenum cofactor biosynthesis protein YqeB n=1 Tax=Anaerotignum lactatifermentans TaxID=160404 RepID=UPI002673F5E7|nr:selenium-dependent molybdenum cofactor biosynthesis protein YqeB [Anaerotignum lactatifermentans]
MKKPFPIVVRGGGDLATGTIHKLYQAGFPVIVLETANPSAIRRYVAFSEAVYEGEWTVEGVTAIWAADFAEAQEILEDGNIPVLIDPNCKILEEIQPQVLIDAILAKKNLGTTMDMAETVIALGPGFTAGVDAHLVIETQRGHNLGRVLTEGAAAPNTGIPGVIAGYGKERVIHAPAAGILQNKSKIGDLVEKGQTIAMIGDVPVTATLTGVLRGLIRDGYPVTEGFKIADIDPRESEQKNCYTISDKARCIAGGVLEGILMRNRGSFIWKK